MTTVFDVSLLFYLVCKASKVIFSSKFFSRNYFLGLWLVPPSEHPYLSRGVNQPLKILTLAWKSYFLIKTLANHWKSFCSWKNLVRCEREWDAHDKKSWLICWLLINFPKLYQSFTSFLIDLFRYTSGYIN